MVLSIENFSWEILGMGVLGVIVWTRQLQDPSHREEQETWIPVSMA
jgi:hypothetical protein